jgi:N-methylhydantoinase A
VSAGAFLGVDIGGTFTDVVLSDERGAVHVGKVLTTPHDPRQAVRRGIEEVLHRSGTDPGAVTRVVHGTTLATNVILQRAGARVAFVTTAGFGDMLRLGREARVEDDRYDLRFTKPEPPVDHRLTIEVPERIGADGSIVVALDPVAIAAAVTRLAGLRPEAIAICLVNSHANDAHEAALAAACRQGLPGTYLAVSTEVWPEVREFDRAMTTVMSAYVGPRMAEYLSGLESELEAIGVRCGVEIMESSGGVMSAAIAARRPIYTVESGGAAGVTAAGTIGAAAGFGDVISFDMGGTTAKAGVVRGGRPDVTHDFQVGGKGSFGSMRAGTGFPVKVPVVDLAEVGAGGGSIAWVDPGGVLRVGPQSAGSDPGPVCYGKGGTAPTVTDANVVLGYIDPAGIADDLQLDRDAALAAIDAVVAQPLGLDPLAAAWAIHDLANASMAAAIRVVTVQRGIDPRRFAVVAFGGAGPLHACRLADTFGIGTVVVPWAAGVASAIGLLSADLTVHRVRAVRYRLDDTDPSALEHEFVTLAQAASAELAHDGEHGAVRVTRQCDVRHVGQAHQLTVDVDPDPVDGEIMARAGERFRSRYRAEFGIALDSPLEIVHVRVTVSRGVDKVALGDPSAHVGGDAASARRGEREAWVPPDGPTTAAVYDWAALPPGATFDGPAIVQGADATVLVPGTRQATVDPHRNLVLDARPPS